MWTLWPHRKFIWHLSVYCTTYFDNCYLTKTRCYFTRRYKQEKITSGTEGIFFKRTMLWWQFLSFQWPKTCLTVLFISNCHICWFLHLLFCYGIENTEHNDCTCMCYYVLFSKCIRFCEKNPHRYTLISLNFRIPSVVSYGSSDTWFMD